eukprot:401719_1
MKLFYYNMSTLLYAITTITLTNAAAPATYSPTPLFPTPSNGSIIPITGATGFQCIVSVHVSIWTSIYKLHNQKKQSMHKTKSSRMWYKYSKSIYTFICK